MIPPPIFPSIPKPIKPSDQEKHFNIQQKQQQQQQDGENYFELLPDPILSTILDKILDAKSLCRCLIVSKRLASLVPQVDTVSVVVKPTTLSTSFRPKKPFSLKSLFAKLLHPTAKKTASSVGPGELSRWISNSIKNFSEIRHLRVQLPGNGGVVGFPDTPGGLLKWSAEFGKDLRRCAIIGATAFEIPSSCATNSNSNLKEDQHQHQHQQNQHQHQHQHHDQHQQNQHRHQHQNQQNHDQHQHQHQHQNQNPLSDEELRSRVVWILSTLIAACSRHGVARQTLMDHPGLCSAVIEDALKQGMLYMNEDQIKEVRESKDSELDDEVWKRTSVPNVIVKLWYEPELVLPTSGYVMKGATVVAIRPDTGCPEDGGAVGTEYELLKGGFGVEDEVIGEAVREIVKSKWKMMYKLHMNSF